MMIRVIKFLLSIAVLLALLISGGVAARQLDREQRKEALDELSQKFDKNKSFYLSSKYKENDVREDFINPFLDIFGWDTQNSKQVLLFQQDSTPEARLDIYKYTKYVDYNQRINDRSAFFVEAKAASKDIDNPDYIFQAKRYCWSSSKVELVLLTDYETLRAYDCRIKPDYNKPRQGELKQFRLNYKQYADNERLLWETLSKENVAKGSIQSLLTRANKKLERLPMEKSLVKDLDSLRLNLAEDIYKNNKSLSEKAISEASQNILNKLLFTRILEDRDIITSKKLQYAVMTFYKDDSLFMGNKGQYLRKEKMREPKKTLFLEIQEYFKESSKKFNGVIFAPHFSDNLNISDEVLRDTIKELYGSYDFSIVPMDVIGKAYESYLGRTVSIKDGKVEIREHPETRSAGGVFYSPEWIARYMVEKTVGEKTKNKAPEEISKIKVLDPACGSGVFPAQTALILFKAYEDYYTRNPDKIGGTKEFPDAYKLANGSYTLSPKKKAEIIESSVFCTDIDNQATENTKMLLYILILEDSGSSTAQKNRAYKIPNKVKLGKYENFRLPTLSENIINANFLISTDFGSPEENKRVRAFDWKSGKTGDIIKAGGFDVIVGNPPYIQSRKFSEYEPKQYQYLRSKYKTIKPWQSDIFYTFFERGDTLLNQDGELSYIVSNVVLTGKTAKILRYSLQDRINRIVDFGYNKVFPGIGTTSAILFTNQGSRNVEYIGFSKVKNIERLFLDYLNNRDNKQYVKKNVNKNELTAPSWSFNREDNNILQDNKAASLKLSDIANIFQGQSSGMDKAFIIKETEIQSFEKSCLIPFVRSSDIKRYIPVEPKSFMIYPYNNKGKLLSEDNFREVCPNIYEYLNQFKSVLLTKKGRKADNWFKLARNANYALSMKPKIYTNFVNSEPQNFTLDSTGGSFFIGSIVYGISSKNASISNEALLGVLNSSLIREYLSSTGDKVGEYQRHRIGDLKDIPIVPYNLATKNLYKEIEDRVKQILAVKHRKVDTSILERRIDDLVLILYRIKPQVQFTPSKESIIELRNAV